MKKKKNQTPKHQEKRKKIINNISKSGILLALVAVLGCSIFYLKNYNKKRENKHIVVVIPSYNNIKWFEKNVDSVANQNYDNWSAIYIDDCSKDGTGDAVEKYIKDHKLEHKIKLIKNKIRCGAMANFYNVIHTCKDSDIIVVCDGDDWLKDKTVLSYINKVYQDNNVWMTYGQYEEFPSGNIGLCKQIPDVVTRHNHFRHYKWLSSHLRTFYAGLFKKIKKEDFMYEEKFLPATGDMAAMFPMLEMAGDHAKFISKVLYVYNMDNPLNDYKERLELVLHLDKFVRGKEKYNRIDSVIT